MSANKILIVEDEAVVSLDISRRLEKMGYEVMGRLASGEEAIELIQQERPDLVLMDINLQGEMDGIETATKLYKDHNLPVIYLTAYAGQSTLERAKESKPYGYILKPFKERELHAAIEIAISRHETE
ncbi:response regulator receiver protein [Halothece sp. PCC 7418]|uniref:response regulator n=1 Tax=Halothece sp. (strain PCC 7418) TaxID=65093 RepID=UPI0002A0858D|nr:response regulator [Halothece sp. PCC 7418]AFZ44992.1 response regulator receiver protein [Halothece sp. PCC 7418]